MMDIRASVFTLCRCKLRNSLLSFILNLLDYDWDLGVDYLAVFVII